MNVWRALLAPWVAATRSMRWLAGIIMGLCILVAIVLLAFHVGNDATAGIFALAPAVGLWWVFFLPNTLVLKLSAKNLHLPGIGHDATASLWLYAVLSIPVPALILGLAGANVLTGALILALCAGGCMLYSTAPGYVSSLIVAALIAAPEWPTSWAPPAPGEPGFITLATMAVLLLLLADILRWRQLQHVSDRHLQALRRPTIMNLNRNAWAIVRGNSRPPAGHAVTDSLTLLRQRPDRLQREADLRGIGPDFPHRTLRVALGGGYLPQTRKSRLRQEIAALWPLAFIAILFAILGWQMAPAFARVAGNGGIWVLLLMIIPIIIVAFAVPPIVYVRQMWHEANTQLPMLALLPHLGPPADIRRALLETMLRNPLRLLGSAWICLLALALYIHLPTAGIALVLVVPPAWACILAVGLLHVFGGSTRIAQHTFTWVICPAAMILTGLDVLVSFLLLAHVGSSPMAGAIHGLALGWLALAIALGVTGRRGWQRFRHRPHPFLANTR